MQNDIKILFATDFSQDSKVALKTLKNMQNNYNADIHILHVIASSIRSWLSSGMLLKEGKQRLETWGQKLCPEKSKLGKLYIKTGNAADNILQQARTLDVDLIVLGEGQHGNLKPYHTGNTAEAVTRSTRRSVWLCKSEKITNVLCGVDGSEPSVKALNEAIDLCRRFNANLTIIHVLPKPNFNPLGMEESEIEQEETKFKNKRIETITKVLQNFDFSGIAHEILYPWGRASRVILNMANDFDYDLIVVGAHGRSLLKQVLIGNTAGRILRLAPCSLLIVR